jgi:hypothetical protein
MGILKDSDDDSFGLEGLAACCIKFTVTVGILVVNPQLDMTGSLVN